MLLDEQAAMESSFVGMWASLCGTNLAHDTAYLGSGMVGALEALVLNDEIISYTRKVLDGINIDEDALALEVINKVGHGGHYMGEDHTLENFRNEFWQTDLLNRDMLDSWRDKGEKTLGDKLKEKVKSILENHEPEPLSEEVISKLKEILGS